MPVSQREHVLRNVQAETPVLLRRGWVRRTAAAFVFVVLAAFILQATVHPDAAGHMTHDARTVAATDLGCDHPHPAGSADLPLKADHDSPAKHAQHLQDDCCDQLCASDVLLSHALPTDRPWDSDYPFPVWSDRLGRVPEGILRPPRLSATA